MTGCSADGTHLIVGCDANSHHTSWGSTDINNRGESLFNCIMANGLDIMNRGNKPTFLASNRQEVVDITIATVYAGNFIKDWHVTEEVSCSDHRYIPLLLRILANQLKFIANHAGPTGSLSEATCWIVCAI